MNQHLQQDSGQTIPSAYSPAAGYRFVLASDEVVWPGEDGGRGGLSQVSEQAQLDGFDRITRGCDALVIVCGTREVAAVRRASALARSQSQARIAVVPIELGPLGQDAVVALGKALVTSARTRPAAELVGCLPEVADHLLDLALVSGVASLDLPGIGVRHHLRSYLPGRHAFAVQLAPSVTIARITRAGRLRPASATLNPPDFDEGLGAMMAVAGPRSLPEAVLKAAGSSSAPPRLASTPALSAFWGDDEATEVVVVPADVTRWARSLLPPVPMIVCSWCDEPLAATRPQCVFCGHVNG